VHLNIIEISFLARRRTLTATTYTTETLM